MTPFSSPDAITSALTRANYIPSPEISTVLYLAETLRKPILVEGPAGVGKTDLARAAAEASGRGLIRLQCYEGLDEAKALYEWEYAKQLLYTQILRDKVGELVAGTRTLTEAVERVASAESAFFSRRFLVPRPLLAALLADSPTALLIDEVDKADPEFEAFLLEILSEWQVSVPELGTIAAKTPPLTVLTSNGSRELSDALKRRCLYLWLDPPTEAREREILVARVPALPTAIAEGVVAAVRRLRALDLRKGPAVAEAIDWARALLALGATKLDRATFAATAGALLKHEEDLRRAAASFDP